MKKLVIALMTVSSLLSGCVAYPVPVRDQGVYHGGDRDHRDQDRDGVPNRADRDRDGDGVRNSQDSRPNDPRRY